MQLGNALFQFSYIPSMCDYNFVNTNDTFGFFVVGLKCFTFCKIDYGSSWRSGQRDFLDNGKWEKSGFFSYLKVSISYLCSQWFTVPIFELMR